MDRYGYKGDVSFYGQNRFKAYYNGPAGCPAPAGFGNVRPVLSGNYVGAPGKRIMRQQTSREQDGSLFASLGVRMAGPRYDGREVRMRALSGVSACGLGSVRDREMCRTLTAAGGALIGVIGTAAGGARPTRGSGETAEAFQRRVTDWETQQRLLTAAGGSATALTALCNLIETGETTPPASGAPSGMSAYERALLERYNQSSQASTSSGGISNQTLLLGAGALLVGGVAVYLLVK